MTKQILVNIGNTNSEFAILQHGTLLPLLKVATSEVLHLNGFPEVLKPYFCVPLVGVSVVPKVTEKLSALWSKSHWVTAGNTTLLDFGDVDMTTVGADRVANAIAIKAFGLPAIVIDFGTAITTEVVDGSGRFIGGAILPGRILVRKALADNTGQLPLIPLTESLPSALGKNTVDALTVVDLAVVGGVEKLITETRKELKLSNCPVYATGGDAAYFRQTIPELKELPKDFTMQGIITIAQSL